MLFVWRIFPHVVIEQKELYLHVRCCWLNWKSFHKRFFSFSISMWKPQSCVDVISTRLLSSHAVTKMSNSGQFKRQPFLSCKFGNNREIAANFQNVSTFQQFQQWCLLFGGWDFYCHWLKAQSHNTSIKKKGDIFHRRSTYWHAGAHWRISLWSLSCMWMRLSSRVDRLLSRADARCWRAHADSLACVKCSFTLHIAGNTKRIRIAGGRGGAEMSQTVMLKKTTQYWSPATPVKCHQITAMFSCSIPVCHIQRLCSLFT